MKWIERLSVASRLYLLLIVLLLAMALVGGFALRGMGASNAGMEAMYTQRLVPLKLLRRASEAYSIKVARAAVDAAMGNIYPADAIEKINAASAESREYWQAFLKDVHTSDQEERDWIDQAGRDLDKAAESLKRLMDYLQAEDGDKINEFVMLELNPSLGPLTETFDFLIDHELKLAEAQYQQAQADYRWVRNLSLAIMLASMAIGVLFAVWLVRGLMRQLGADPSAVVPIARRIAAGEVDFAIDVAGADRASLLAAMAEMQRVLQRIVADIRAAVDAAGRGDFSRSIDADSHQGFARDIAAALNQVMRVTDAGLSDIQRVARALAQGDLSQTITQDYPGVFGQTRDGVNRTVESLRSIVSEIEALVSAAASEGDFSVRLDLAGKQGFSQRLAELLNRLAEVTHTGLSDILRVSQSMAEGDLSQQIQRSYPGLFGRARDGLNSSVAEVAAIIQGIQQSTQTIRQASGEIAAGNGDLSVRTEQQAANLEETASSLEELTSTVKQNTDNARQARQLAVGATDIASRGGQVVGQVVSTMSDISASSNKIADIIGVIDGIAFQTNILALNAAVEAARAGEQGRGFAVVASEVRSLAQRSAEAAKEIKSLIEESTHNVTKGAGLVGDAGRTMEEIVTAIRRVSDLMGEIAAASDEQSAGIEQVNQTVIQLDEATQQNAALVEQATAAARALEDQAEQLSEAAQKFRLG